MSARMIVATVKRQGWRAGLLTLVVAMAAVVSSRPSAGGAAASAAPTPTPARSAVTVVAVPWQGSRTKPHSATQNGTIVLQAVASNGGDGNPVTLSAGTWDPGDGSSPQAIDVSNSRDLELSWTYAGAVGTSYTATISVTDTNNVTVTDTFSVQVQPATLDTQVNMALDRALWYNHKAMKLDTDTSGYTLGFWDDTEPNASTSAAVQAFEVNGHLESGSAATDPYVDDVARGLRYLQQHLQRIALTTLAGAGSPLPAVPFAHVDASAPADVISPNLQLSRDASGVLSQQGSDTVHWLFGTCAAPSSPTYYTFDDLFWNYFWYAPVTGGRYDYFSVPGQTVCLLDVTTDQAYDLTFTAWSGYFASTAQANNWDQDYYGYDYLSGMYAPVTAPGGFAYTRSQYSGGIAAIPDLQGHAGTTDDPGPDVNGNGYGLQTDGANVVYVGGQIIEAFVASGTPTATAAVGTEAGRSYADIVQDLIDTYSWGQTDPFSLMPNAYSPNGYGGGWIYNWNDNFDNIDSSSSGWWGVGARAAEVWHITMPQWVKDLNLNYGIPQLQDDQGRCGYRGAVDVGSNWSTMTETTACMLMLSADGQGRSSAAFTAAENWVAANYGNAYSQNPGTVEPIGSIYTMYNLTKAMRLAKDASGNTAPITLLGGTIDWYGGLPVPGDLSDPHNGLAYNLVLTQRADGKLAPQNAPGVYDGLANSWGILILSPTLFGETSGTTSATVTAGSGTKVYGDLDPTLTPTFTGFLASDNISVTETSRDAGESVGSYATHATATGSAIGNYSITNNSGTLVITAATPVVTVTGGTFTYDGQPKTGTCAVAGVNAEVLTGVLSYSSGSAPTATGSYAVSCDIAASGNYTAASGTATITITPASSTTVVTCTPSVVFTGAAQAVCAANVTGAGGLDQAVTPLTYTNNTNVGTATASASYAGDANHSASAASSTFDITPAPSTTVVTCTPSVVYTGAAQEVCAANVTGAGGLDAAVTPLTYGNNTNVGTASASATFAGDANHNSSTGSGSFAITKASSTTTVTCSDAVYTGSPLTTCTATVTGVGGLDAAVTALTYANNTNVGTASASATFAGDANHSSSTGSGTFAITKASAICTVTGYAVVYDGTAHTATGSCVGVGGDGTLSAAALTLTGTSHTAAGSYAGDPWTFAGTSNYNATSGTVSDSISKATPTTTATGGTFTYDGTAHAGTCSVNSGVAGDTFTGALSYSPGGSAAPVAAGSYTVNCDFAGTTNYSAAVTSTAAIAINRAAATVTAGNGTKVYGSADPTLTATSAGFLGADGITVTETTREAGETVGSYATHATATGAAISNYSVTFTNGSLSITAATPVATATGGTFTYDAVSHSGACVVTGVGTDVLTGVSSYSPGTGAPSTVGSYTLTCSFAATTNYTAASSTAAITITPAASTTVVTCPTSVAYTGAAQAVCTATVTGAGGLDAAVTPLTYTNNTNVGTASVSATFAGDANHAGSTGSGSFTITPAASTTVVTCPTSVAFTGSAQAVCTATVTGAGGLNQAVTPVTYTSNTNVGTASASASFAGDANHASSTGSGSFTITPAASTTVVTCPTSVAYTGTAQAVCTATVTGAGGLDQAVTPVTYTSNTNVGTASASASFAGDANHAGSTGSGSFTITPAASTTVVTCPASVAYTGTAQAVCTATVTGAGGLDQAVTPVTYTSNTAVGTASASASFAGDANHAGSTGSGSFTITKANATCTVTGYAVVYDGSAHTATGSCVGVGGDGTLPAAALTLTGTTHTAAGTYATDPWNFAGTSNYNALSGTVANSISKVTPVATATGGTFTYDGAAHAGACTVAGINADTLTGAISYSSGTAPAAAGTYTVSCDFAASGNYTAAVTSTATLTITKAAATVTAGSGTKVYGSADPTLAPTSTGFLGADSIAVTATAREAGETVGSYATHATATGAAISNYSVTYSSGSLSITAATPVATATGGTFAYDGTSHAGTCTVAGLGTDALTGVTSYSPGGGAPTVVGTYTLACSYAATTNYTTASSTATITITPAASTTVVTCPTSVAYTGAAQTGCTATVTGAGGLNAAVTPVTYTSNTAVGTANASASFAGDANHASSTGASSFTITPAASTTVVTCPTSVAFTGSAQTVCTATVTGAGGLNAAVTPVTYTSNTAVGTASASASFAGDANHASSTGASSFTITPAASTTVVTCPTSVAFTGLAQAVCTATVTGAGGLDAAVTPLTYTNNTNVGTASASATFAGDANHASSTGSSTFAITLAPSTTVVTCPTSVAYTGTAQEVCTATVTGAGGLNAAVTPVTYATNTAVGTANASASFAGDANHAGSTGSGSFTITPAASTTVVTCPTSVAYTGTAQTVCTATVTGAGGLNQAVTPVTYTTNTAVGTASASASFAGDANHASSTGASTFTITPAASTTVVTCPTSVAYTGTAQTVCTATVTGAGGLNAAVTPVTYTSNTAVGTASASASFAGDANHASSTASSTFAITPAPSTTVVTCPTSVAYTGTAQEVCTATVTGAGGLNQAVTPVTYTTNTAVGTASASASFAGDANHASSTGASTFTITPAASTTVVTCPTSVAYTGTAQTVCTATVTGAGGLNAAVTPVTYTSNTNVGTATASASFTGDANHAASTGSSTFAITPAPSTTVVTCPTSVVYTGAVQMPCTATVTGAGGLNATVGLVTYTSNTNAGTAGASASNAGDANHSSSTGSSTFTITKANPTCTVTGYSVAYDGANHTATGSCTGVGGANLTGGLNVAGTTHSAAGDYPADPWTFTDGTGNYNNLSGTVHDLINFTQPPAACSIGYPFASTNPLTSVLFNESEVMRGFSHTGTGANETIRVWYSDEHALTLGVNQVQVKTSSGTTTTSYGVTALPSNPGSAVNPAVGATALTGDQAGTDTTTPSGRPMYPALFITDITTNPNSLSGDWQYGGAPIAPHAVFGTWKAAARLVDKTKSTVTITPGADPTAKNSWSLGAGADAVPAGLTNDGYGAEVRWNVSALGLQQGHVYRIQFMVHDGDQNKVGGDAGEGCLNVIPGVDNQDTNNALTTPVAEATGGTFVYNGQPETGTCTVTGANNVALTGVSTYSSGAAPVAVGTYVLTCSYAATSSYNAANDQDTITITPAPTTTVVTCPPTVIVTGAPLAPCTAIVTSADGLNQAVTPVTYTNNTNLGTATASASYAGDANHASSTGSSTFTIGKVPSTTVVTCPTSVAYTGSAQTVCTATVTGAGGLNQAATPVTYSNNTNAGTATASASFAGDANYASSTGSSSFTITKVPASVTPNAAAKVFGAADPALTGTFSGFLAADGVTASYSRTAGETVAGSPYTISATLSPSGVLPNYSITYNTAPFTIIAPLSLACPAATGQAGVAYASSLAVTSGRAPFTLSLASGSLPPGLTLNADGSVTGTPTTVGSFSFIGQVVDASSTTATTSGCGITIAAPSVSMFVIGDTEAHGIGGGVNFWGSQWWQNNQMSGAVGNGVASFKGYADQSDNVCGGAWTSRPGNSSNPPPTIPDYVAIIVTDTVDKSGPNISGHIKQILIVHQDGGYGPNPGHDGNGTVVSIACNAYVTNTQASWNVAPSGNNAGMLLTNSFGTVYPQGVTIGGAPYSLKFTSTAAIQAFLPAGGKAAALNKSATNPTSSSANVFAGDVLSLQLAVDFSNAGVTTGGLSALKVTQGNPMAGSTVAQVLAVANQVLAGNTSALPAGVTLPALDGLISSINQNYNGGATNNGLLAK